MIAAFLCASSGDDIVKFAAASRFKMYTSFAFSIAAIITLLPFGSVAKYCPGTIRRAPDFPYVSWCSFTKLLVLGS
jgi:hypothetical protein